MNKFIHASANSFFSSEFKFNRVGEPIQVYEDLKKVENQLVIIKHIRTDLTFRGQLLVGQDRTLILSTPWITNNEEMAEHSLNLLDFALHDPVHDYVMLLTQQAINMKDIRNLADNLAKEQAKAMELAKAKELFLANMSHEIRTPLNVISGMANLLTGHVKKMHEEYLEAIQQSTKHLSNVINTILDLSKIENGGIELSPREFNLNTFFDSIRYLFDVRANENELLFKIIVDEDVPQFIEADDFRLKQIFINLIGNAIKFTEYGSVTVKTSLIETKENTATLHFEVKDTGVGIKADKLDQVFNMFTQADNSISRKYGGTGLGLTITRNLIDLMGGEIKVDSVFGLGTRFHFEITVPVPEVVVESHDSQPSTFQNLSGIKILVAEDNSYNQMLISAVLENLMAEYQIADNGKKALEALEKKSFDIILMDIQMPIMDGIESLKNLRKKGFTLPVIALTANALTGDRERFIEIGFDSYISKPFEDTQIVEQVCKLLSHTNSRSLPSQPHSQSDEFKDGIVDLYNLERLAKGNADFINKMVNVFLREFPNQVLQIKQAIDEQSIKSLCHHLHKINSGLATVASEDLVNKVANLEQLAKAGSQNVFERCTELLANFTQLQEELESHSLTP